MIITVRDMTRLQHLNQTLLATLEYIPYPVGVALQNHEKAPVTSYHMNKAALKLFGIEPYGLTQEDIDLLKRQKRQKKVRFERLLVQETLPFAPIIFAGTVLSFFTTMFLFF